GDARLQDDVAAGDAAGLFVEPRAVERMAHRADELVGRVAWELRVGVERDDVADRREGLRVAGDRREGLAAAGGEERVEVGELAALPLVPHPGVLAVVPDARAMEQEEEIAAAAGVPVVELGDPLLRELDELLVVVG